MSDNTLKKHVLIISDDPCTLVEIKMELMGHFEVSIAPSGAVALAVLEMYDNIAAVVINIGEKHEKKAFSVFADIFAFVYHKNVPIIFLAEKSNDEDEIAAFMIGAADYTERRHCAPGVLINRIKLRISAGECERRILSGKADVPSFTAAPETVLNDKTILVVDDIELNREIVACMLSEIESLTLEFAGDGREAVAKFAKDPKRYSLILMDVQMPGMNGLEAARAIRSLGCENARDIPIIATTGDADEDEVELCLEAGMDDCIEKPMAHDELLAVIAKYCRGW